MKKIYLVLFMLFYFAFFNQSIVKAGQWNPTTHQYIPGYGQVVLYDSVNCREESGSKPYVVLNVGDYPKLTSLDATGGGNWNDRTSCLHVGPQTKIVVYQDIDHAGNSMPWSEGIYNLRNTSWDGKISSCIITAIPRVNIKATDKNGVPSDGPVQIYINTSSTLSWTSENAASCSASGAWSGSKTKSGSASTGPLTSSKTYTLTCTSAGGSASDSVTINVVSSGGSGGGGGTTPRYK